jgi:hypothetical protein
MSLTPDQASDSLKEIERTGRRSAQALQYANASPGFILWGVIWMIGYAGSDLLPQTLGWRSVNWLWFTLTIIGVSISFAIGQAQRRARPMTGPSARLRWGATILVLWVFVIATFAVLRPANPVASGAFIPLVIATIYAVFGIWGGLRFLYAGIAVAVLTLGGFFFLPQHFLLWMAFVGGGSLVLAGLWLRKI